MKREFWFFLFFIAFGLLILCWPEGEYNVMLVQFSETHGPSKLDTIGLCVLMVGYIPLLIQTIKRSNFIVATLGGFLFIFLIALYLIFLVLIGVALNLSQEVLLWVSVFMTTCSQGILFFCAFRKTTGDRPDKKQ